MYDYFRRRLFASFLLYRKLSLRGLLRLLRILIKVRHGALAFPSIAANSPHFLVVAFRAFQGVVVCRGTRVKLVGSRSGDSNDCGRVCVLFRRPILVNYTYDEVRSNVVDAHVSSIDLGRFNRFFRLLATRAMSGA